MQKYASAAESGYLAAELTRWYDRPAALPRYRSWQVGPPTVTVAETGELPFGGRLPQLLPGAGLIVTGPLADSRRADLATVTDLAGRCGRRAMTSGALGLLRACLEYRFGADVALGTGPAAASGRDDIAITEAHPEPELRDVPRTYS